MYYITYTFTVNTVDKWVDIKCLLTQLRVGNLQLAPLLTVLSLHSSCCHFSAAKSSGFNIAVLDV